MYALETLTVDRARARLADAACREVFDYWDRLRGERAAPDRRELEPFDIAPALGDMVLLETAGDDAVFRLAGSRLTLALGRELRGGHLSSLWQEPDQRRLHELLRLACTLPAGVFMDFDMRTVSGRNLDFECVLLPLQLDGPVIRRLIGAVAPVQRPYWLGTDPLEGFALRKAAFFPTRSDALLASRQFRSHPVFDRATPRRTLRHLALYDGDLA
ncbi:MAG: PAS domain-containing protein [Rhodobiaceae bacterium]|nr:PAS domain-containing protein [Rhodobiaceae bacterium]MCC0016963.1 PAS domain-containing protein [Rhodobiaceae bacterium]MCC0042339.1 PAS domain-containing protein [Rhodobiaceae bacterium]MCC0054133.1 PAS domain-containing protein [Rhodobiaceae bacterium]